MSVHGSRPAKSKRKLGIVVTALATGGLAAGGIAVASNASADVPAPQIKLSITTESANVARTAQRNPDTNKLTEARRWCETQISSPVTVKTVSSTQTQQGNLYTVEYVFECVETPDENGGVG